ncbi:MAG: peptidoglycan DD-metalloendopeptidase family protein [Candidatus Margulisiibacteriota bacterium]
MTRQLLIIVLLLTSLSFAQNNAQDIQQELKENTAIINKKKKQERSILKELGNLRTNIYITQKKLNQAYQKYNSYKQQINQTESKLSEEKDRLVKTKEFLNQKVLRLYKDNQQPVLSLIFNSESFSSLINNMYFYEKIIENDFKELQMAQQKINEFQISKKRLEYSKKQANQLKDNILKQRYALKHTKSRYQKSLRSLRSELKQFEERNEVLRQESQQLSNYIQQKSPDTPTKVYYGSGTYLRPVGGYISSRFGLRRHPIFKRRRMHTGMDFAAPRGYRIKAVDSGKVLFSGFKRGYGNVTIINHGWYKNKKISSLYAHQWKMIVQKGQFVKKGQLIGYVGSTGYSTGPHLHFEIRENGKPVNPSQYLRL